MVEYLVNPESDDGSVGDWSALRLAFAAHDGEWFLVGVIHHAQTM